MALTLSRTRTQTTLNKLVEMVANVHGELDFLEAWLAEGEAAPTMLAVRRQKLLVDRDALYATARQFDPSIAPELIRGGDVWQKAYGRGGVGRKLMVKTLRARYLYGGA